MDRSELRADCERCVGLCCVAPALSASADFAIDKPAGQPCPNLRPDFRCGIHDQLRQRGFPGCTAYDCFGAGQRVAQVTFAGRDWRTPEVAARLFAAFGVMRQLHELLWYLTEALALPAARPMCDELGRAAAETERLAGHGPDAALAGLDGLDGQDSLDGRDVGAHRTEVGALLRRGSELARAGLGGRGLVGAGLVGRNLRGADLRGADLRGAYLVGADLTGAGLRLADPVGADPRGARLGRADLGTTLFLTQPQVASARGDDGTALPAWISRPVHWSPQGIPWPAASAHEAATPRRSVRSGPAPRSGPAAPGSRRSRRSAGS